MKNVTQIRLPQSNAIHYMDKNAHKDNDNGIVASVHKSNVNTMVLGQSGKGMTFNRKMAEFTENRLYSAVKGLLYMRTETTVRLRPSPFK